MPTDSLTASVACSPFSMPAARVWPAFLSIVSTVSYFFPTVDFRQYWMYIDSFVHEEVRQLKMIADVIATSQGVHLQASFNNQPSAVNYPNNQ